MHTLSYRSAASAERSFVRSVCCVSSYPVEEANNTLLAFPDAASVREKSVAGTD